MLFYFFSSFLVFWFLFFSVSCSEKLRTTDPIIEPPYITANNVNALIITEVGLSSNNSVWLEIYNPSTNNDDLANYSLRCYGAYISNDTAIPEVEEFPLTTKDIAPGNFVIIRGNPYNENSNFDDNIFINKIQNGRINFPYIKSDGTFFFELKARSVVTDFLQSGSSTSPSEGQFTGDAPLLVIRVSNDYNKSIARKRAFADNDAGSDWSLANITTAGGPNDVTNATDTDRDGIPDANESPNSTFFGMPLYEWGARADKKDLFVYINYMDKADRGVTPQKEALDKIKSALSNKEIAIHFDVGNLFNKSSGINPSLYNLSDVSLAVPHVSNIGNFNEVYDYKNTYLPIDKRQIFYYALFVDTYGDTTDSSPLGIAELFGTHMIISTGSIFSSNTVSNLVINYQAGVIMHELGHNLGLRHGGDERQNYKPNYYSVMNYLYALRGLSPAGAPGDRYHYQVGYNTNEITLLSLSNGPYSESFQISYSDGISTTLNESNLNENLGIGRDLGSIDWNTNGSKQNENVYHNINPDGGEAINTISDYNDWSNLRFVFYPNQWGTRLSSSLLNVSAPSVELSSQNKSNTWSPPCSFPMDHQK